MSKQKINRRSKAKSVEQTKTLPFGWNTSDEDEIKHKIIRSQSEEMEVHSVDSKVDYFKVYKVSSVVAGNILLKSVPYLIALTVVHVLTTILVGLVHVSILKKYYLF